MRAAPAATLTLLAMLATSACESTGIATGGASTSSATVAASRPCAVAWVTDGDTLRCQDGTRVRILGLDAPELGRNGKPADCWANESRRALSKLVTGRTVTLTGDPDQPQTDVYGRRLAYVDARGDVSLRMIRAGAARARTSRPPLGKATELASTQAAARGQHRGLWSGCQNN